AAVVGWLSNDLGFGSFSMPSYEASVPLQVAYALFGFALGLVVSALVRRTVLTMVITMVVFVAARIAVGLWRPHFLAPLRFLGDSPPRGPSRRWGETRRRDGGPRLGGLAAAPLAGHRVRGGLPGLVPARLVDGQRADRARGPGRRVLGRALAGQRVRAPHACVR